MRLWCAWLASKHRFSLCSLAVTRTLRQTTRARNAVSAKSLVAPFTRSLNSQFTGTKSLLERRAGAMAAQIAERVHEGYRKAAFLYRRVGYWSLGHEGSFLVFALLKFQNGMLQDLLKFRSASSRLLPEIKVAI